MPRSAEELYGILGDPANVTDSPDLGPPPVAHFEDGDPIKFDSRHEPSRTGGAPETTEEEQPMLSSNLETRKKRRESSHHRDIEEKSSTAKQFQEATHKDPALPIVQPLKSGAKRKLHAREDEDQAKDAFHFSRKASESRSGEINVTKSNPCRTSKPANDKTSQTTAVDTQPRNAKSAEAPATSTIMNRKVLGPSELLHDLFICIAI